MTRRDTVVIGASAGGVEALKVVIGGLPVDLQARVLIVLHIAATRSNALAAILERCTDLKVRAAEHGEILREGSVLVAPPDHHLVVVDDEVVLTRGPMENGHRPAVDVLFRSAAKALGPRVIGVILSGTLDDGSAGLRAVRSRGGVGVVQEPGEALYSGMPENAIHAARPEHVLPVADIAALLVRLVAEAVEVPPPPPSPLMEVEVAMAAMEPAAYGNVDRPGHPSGYSCPDCHGVLFSLPDPGQVRFRCRVGHAWSAESLVAEHRLAVESSLWMALRALEEKAALCHDLAERAQHEQAPLSAARFLAQAQDATTAAELMRKTLESGAGMSADEDGGGHS